MSKTALGKLGFVDAGPMQGSDLRGLQGQVFLHEQERAYALVVTNSLRHTWVEVFSEYTDAKHAHYGVTNALTPYLDPSIPTPVYFVYRALPKVPVDLLFADFLQKRPAKALPVSLGRLIPLYNRMSAGDAAWRRRAARSSLQRRKSRFADEPLKVRMVEAVSAAYEQAREVMRSRVCFELRQLLTSLRQPKHQTKHPPAKPIRISNHVSIHILCGVEPEYPVLTGAGRTAGIERALTLLASPKKEIQLNSNSCNEPSLAQLVVETGSAVLAKAFLDAGASRRSKHTALSTACRNQAHDLLALLIDHGANPNRLRTSECPPLSVAASLGDYESVALLLKAGADAKALHLGRNAKAEAAGPRAQAILALLEQSAPKPPAKAGTALELRPAKRKFRPAAMRGVNEFSEAFSHPEWAIGFIEAPAALVAAAFARLHPKAKWFADTAHCAVQEKPPVIFLLQLKGNAWTILIHSVFRTSLDDLPALTHDLVSLSSKLDCRSVAYFSEDTFFHTEYTIWDGGRPLEHGDPDETPPFKSSFRPKPAKFNADFPDAAFTPLGIYLPYLFTHFDGDCTKLVLTGVPAGAIKRVDAFKLEKPGV